MKKMETQPKTENSLPQKSFRIFSQRIILSWMFLVFTGWMFLQYLPSQVPFATGFFDIRPVFNPVHLKVFLVIAEALFSTTMLACVFIPGSKMLLYFHLITALIFCFFAYAMKGKIYIPVTAYIIILFSFFCTDEKKFAGIFDYLQTIVVVVIFWYAANYFISWYHYLEANSFKAIINANYNSADISSRDVLAKNVMPWYYIIYLFFIPRIFTTRYNKILLPFAIIIILLEYFLNVNANPGLTFMLIPFINWQKLYLKFNKRSETN